MNILLRVGSCLCSFTGMALIVLFAWIFWITGAMGQMLHEFRFANWSFAAAALGIAAGVCVFWRPTWSAGLGLTAVAMLWTTGWWGYKAMQEFARTQAPSYWEQRVPWFFVIQSGGVFLLAGAALAWFLRGR